MDQVRPENQEQLVTEVLEECLSAYFSNEEKYYPRLSYMLVFYSDRVKKSAYPSIARLLDQESSGVIESGRTFQTELREEFTKILEEHFLGSFASDFTEALVHYAFRLDSLVEGYCRHANVPRDDREDLKQYWLRNLIRAHKSGKAKLASPGYLHTSLRNTYISLRRKNKSRTRVASDFKATVLSNSFFTNPTERLCALRDYLSKLPESERALLSELEEGLTADEIAKRLGKAPGTIRQRISEIHKKLKKEFGIGKHSTEKIKERNECRMTDSDEQLFWNDASCSKT